jgi:hypothetical protein
MISAIDMHVVGCPLPAAVVDRMESIRSWAAMVWRAAEAVMDVAIRFGIKKGGPQEIRRSGDHWADGREVRFLSEKIEQPKKNLLIS